MDGNETGQIVWIPPIIHGGGIYLPPTRNGWAQLVGALPWPSARQLHPNSFLWQLTSLPIVRELAWRNRPNFSPQALFEFLGHSIRGLESMRMQISGAVMVNSCSECSEDRGIYSQCVAIVGYHGLSQCASCYLTGRRCALQLLAPGLQYVPMLFVYPQATDGNGLYTPGQDVCQGLHLTSLAEVERRATQVQSLLEISRPANCPPVYGFDMRAQEERINLRHELAFLREELGDGSPRRRS
ncbi:unnamed protein product [Penicillium pancosmium]